MALHNIIFGVWMVIVMLIVIGIFKVVLPKDSKEEATHE